MTGESSVELVSWLDISVERAIALIGVEETSPDDQFTELARDLSKELGYTALTKTPEYIQSQRRTLATILEEAGIRVFSTKSVDRYKARKLMEQNKAYNHPINRIIIAVFHPLLFGGVFVIMFAVLAKMSEASLWFSVSSTIGLSMIGTALFLLFLHPVIFGLNKDVMTQWRWRTIRLGRNGFNHPIPQPILGKLNAILQDAQATNLPIVIEVDEIVSGSEVEDPFISVRVPNDSIRFYFGVWDEPNFKGSYHIPS
ncbi:MAG: hypothetical protein ABH837_01525 [bacterium]